MKSPHTGQATFTGFMMFLTTSKQGCLSPCYPKSSLVLTPSCVSTHLAVTATQILLPTEPQIQRGKLTVQNSPAHHTGPTGKT